MTIDPLVLNLIALSRAQVLRAFSEAMAMDLAVAPLTIVTPPGLGAATLSTDLARVLCADEPTVLRCSLLTAQDVEPYAVLADGQIEKHPPRIMARLPKERRALHVVVLDEAGAAAPGMVAAALRQISDHSATPVVVVLVGGQDSEEAMLGEIADGLGLHRAHVPGARLSVDPTAIFPVQPILVFGVASFAGSKRGERHLEIDVAEPYEHTMHVTIVADDDMDDDALSDLCATLTTANDPVAIRLDAGRILSLDISPADITTA